MRTRLNRRSRRALITGTLLATLLWRALIPSGFMPATDGSAALVFCPEGMPDMVLERTTGDPHGSDHTEHCPFGAAPSAAPVSSATVAAVRTDDLAQPPAQRYDSPRLADRSARAHQPRAPPA